MDTVRQTVAIMAVSGIQLSLETVELLCRVRDKEITFEQGLELVREKYSMNKQLKIKITKCSDSMMWYSKHIGEVYTVVRDYSTHSNAYLVRDTYGYWNIVRPKDCEIVGEDE